MVYLRREGEAERAYHEVQGMCWTCPLLDCGKKGERTLSARLKFWRKDVWIGQKDRGASCSQGQRCIVQMEEKGDG